MALTVLDLGLLAYKVVRPKLVFAQEITPVLRDRALEIVDERGKVGAQLRVFPADSQHKFPNGDPYPETVLLRPIDPNGQSSVTLATDVRGGGLYLVGAEDPTMARPGAAGAEARLELVNHDGQGKVIRPCIRSGVILPDSPAESAGRRHLHRPGKRHATACRVGRLSKPRRRFDWSY